jgi:hypothetical protein
MPSHFAKLDDDGFVVVVEAVEAAFVEANPDRYEGHWQHCNPPRTFCGLSWRWIAVLDDFLPPTED